MKVRCVSNVQGHRLAVGREYVVLAIDFILPHPGGSGGARYQLIDDSDNWDPAPSELFEICDPRPSRHWQVHGTHGGGLSIAPPEFMADYFHDDLTNGERKETEILWSVFYKLANEFNAWNSTSAPSKYPAQTECVWIGCDQARNVAAFITAGEGPIPVKALTAKVPVLDIEQMVLDIPVTSGATSPGDAPSHSGFYVALAKRGFFVYDWTDVPTTHATGRYQRVAIPTLPITVESLRVEVRDVAGPVCVTASFALSPEIDVTTSQECLRP